MPIELCDYGCGRQARFKMKNGKFCCSKSQNSCPAVRGRISKGNKLAWEIPEIRARNTASLQKDEEWKSKISRSIKNNYENGYLHPRLGCKWSNEERALISQRTKEAAPRGSDNYMWNGGTDYYWHERAWKLFGLNECSVCHITNEDNIKISGMRLTMHCLSNDYSNLTEENWQTVCNACHNRIHNKVENMRRAKYASSTA